MHKNPYPKTIQDEYSGCEVRNERYYDWEAGYQAGYISCVEGLTEQLKLKQKQMDQTLKEKGGRNWKSIR